MKVIDLRIDQKLDLKKRHKKIALVSKIGTLIFFGKIKESNAVKKVYECSGGYPCSQIEHILKENIFKLKYNLV